MNDLQQVMKEAREALEKATPGPWSIAVMEDYRRVIYDHNNFNRHIAEIDHGGVESEQREEDNAHLIANAPTWLSTLLSGLEEVQREIEKLDKEIEKYHKLHDDGYNEMRIMTEELEKLKIALYTHESYDRTVSEMHVENEQLRSEHTSMKKALEWIVECGTDYQSINKARAALYKEKSQCLTCFGDGGTTAENFGDVFSFECPDCKGAGEVESNDPS